jgi:DNA-directed RNA polymerase specialized sigma24 family protein
MKHSARWPKLAERWKADVEGPWSLPYALSREFTRYTAALKEGPGQGQTKKKRPPLESVTNAFLDVFASLTHHLPEPQRLSYQLHLEGLLNHEIAFLLRRSEASVNEAIANAKEQLRSDLGGKRVS